MNYKILCELNWLALLPQSRRDPGSNAQVGRVPFCLVLSVSVWVLSGYSSFLSPSKGMLVMENRQPFTLTFTAMGNLEPPVQGVPPILPLFFVRFSSGIQPLLSSCQGKRCMRCTVIYCASPLASITCNVSSFTGRTIQYVRTVSIQ